MNDYDRNMWWMIVGAALSSEDMRVRVFSRIDPSNCSDANIRGMLIAIEAKDSARIKKGVKEMGVPVPKNGKCIVEILNKMSDDAHQRRMKKMLMTLHATASLTPDVFVDKLKTMITELEMSQ